MTGFDYAVLAIIGLSILLSVMRGLVQEVMALVGWAVAAWLAIYYAAPISIYMPAGIPDERLRYLAALIAIFAGVWLFTALLRITISQFVKSAGLSPVDRLLGAVFGLLRGALFVLLLVLVAGLTSFPASSTWRNAMFSPPFEALARLSLPWIPQALAERIKFD
ncbi:Colicin V production protein [Andreprevotia sp. IGB-42]|uniref:CvpA family protein n=1 Tax=Andreprevotia sp. IGB-42 TaxID=2497473 RepID=UPI00135B23A7|nr:CvpA family protein [Andreprevotia sp. IGB-42]KAF0814998.1 Colicin V production protein [Andreprevotia sp. IGB-42]